MARRLPGYAGSTTSLAKYLRTVLRDKPVRRAISRMSIPSRRCQRLITLNNATSITPSFPCSRLSREGLYVGQYSMQIWGVSGSVLDAIQQLGLIDVGDFFFADLFAACYNYAHCHAIFVQVRAHYSNSWLCWREPLWPIVPPKRLYADFCSIRNRA
ncbi:Uncharacterised protein [Halioglobus japonicus]|nr:Uncharacterised protein [Halioglobus japonicus]